MAALIQPLARPLVAAKYAFLQAIHRRASYPKQFEWDWAKAPADRIALVQKLVARFPDCSYLEIGCYKDDLFREVRAARKIGVDPMRGGNVRKTSDDFFRDNTDTFDVVFIDGLHTYEQVRRDVVNSMRALRPGGWVAMHDMLPRSWKEHHYPVVSPRAWTGDVWKVGFELARTEGVDFRILKIDHGVGVFRLTKPGATLADRMAELRDQPFGYFYEHIGELSLAEWPDAQDWLAGG